MPKCLYHLMKKPRIALTGMLCLLLAACSSVPPKEPMPSSLIPAPQAAASHPLVIVLPGRSDSLRDLQTNGIAPAIQKSWPVADVLLVGATPPYYMDGRIARRLRTQVIEPARRKGYREIWLTGASQGGMGALFYEYAYPGNVTGLVLYAPFMGSEKLIKRIAAAGGPERWQPPMPKPAKMRLQNYQVEMWRLVHDWGTERTRARKVWIACGTEDDFLPAAKLIETQLPPGHFVELDGGHDWQTWDRAATRIFNRIAVAHASPTGLSTPK